MRGIDIRDKINEYMEQYTKLWAFSGSVAAIKNGKVIFEKAYGYANIEHKVKNTTETKYKIWSITKQFTAAAILLLEERGLLKVEDSIKKYFPEYAEINSDIKIYHLLTHTSGIFNYSSLPNSHETFQRLNHKKDDLIKMFLNMPLEFEPGTQWKYCNTGYYLLGMLIERLSGKTYAEFLNENIFLPLGMLNTGVDNGKKLVSNMASGYYLNDDELIHCNYINMDLMLSSGGMYSTVVDLLMWDQALNNGKILSSTSIEKMNTQYKNNYGYGVSININGNRRVIHHNGSCEGFLSEIHRYVDDDFAVVVLSNYGFTATNKLCKLIASIVFGEEYQLPAKPEAFSINEKLLESYLGIYEEQGFKLELKRENNKLKLVIDDEYILPAYPINENTLHHTWIDEEYTFTKDDDGKVYLWGIKKKNSRTFIRYANKEDADTLALINSKSIQEGFKGIISDEFLKEKFSFERLKERFNKELDEGNTTNCVIYKDGMPIGIQTFAKDDWMDRDNFEIDIWRIYLLPDYWGKNLGLEFIEWGINELKNKGYKKAALWVLEENMRARKFYEKAGFIHEGEIRIINVGKEVKEYRYIKQL